MFNGFYTGGGENGNKLKGGAKFGDNPDPNVTFWISHNLASSGYFALHWWAFVGLGWFRPRLETDPIIECQPHFKPCLYLKQSFAVADHNDDDDDIDDDDDDIDDDILI